MTIPSVGHAIISPSTPKKGPLTTLTIAESIRRIFVPDAIRSGLPSHVAAKVCGFSTIDTTMEYVAIYPEDVIAHHRAFIARRQAERPSEEYRDLAAAEWAEFLAHFELRKVALGNLRSQLWNHLRA